LSVAARLNAPRAGANALSLAENSVRGRALLDAWRTRHPPPCVPEPPLPLPRRAGYLMTTPIGSIDEEWAIALEHLQWASRSGVSLCDLYVSIEGRDPPLGLTPDDVFDVIVRAYRTVRRSTTRDISGE
jgi:hypothetical protein